ncbi:hypothetical protein SAMN05444166_1850 [Singulisphaera sp. GP187]|uniref:hypothetical protein n=1 Tax=Singulisphaera sp. GP187 TaxID=1882752 RepID=UPI000926A3DE|nr:hypothetical protein [Singulisphaera sp. GP187]SIN97237.1 hypothetical protein SAMN05444166_1850 [Singulisphaera sp. GP187]
MIELLAIPDWQTPPRTLDDWVAQLSTLAGRVEVSRESTGVSWLEIGSLRLRGYAVLDGLRVEAINFELNDPDPGPATRVIEAAAQALGFEVHPDDPDDESDDEDDD